MARTENDTGQSGLNTSIPMKMVFDFKGNNLPEIAQERIAQMHGMPALLVPSNQFKKRPTHAYIHKPFRSGVKKDMYFDDGSHNPAPQINSGLRQAKLPTKREATHDKILLIRMLKNTTNPDTGELHTSKELAIIFNLTSGTINDHLSSGNQGLRPKPEVRHETLPANEHAFFMGLALDTFTVKKSHRSGEDMIIVETKSEQKAELFDMTLGQWGKNKVPKKDSKKFYLDSNTFDFFNNPEVTEDFLQTPSIFGPFLFGLMASRLSEAESRLSVHYRQKHVLPIIQRKYETHFGKSIGEIKTQTIRGVKSTATAHFIRVLDPEDVLKTLAQVESVRALPFFSALEERGIPPRKQQE